MTNTQIMTAITQLNSITQSVGSTTTTPSLGSWTGTYSADTPLQIKRPTLEEFFKIEDNDVQKYIHSTLGSLIEVENKIIDNDEKYGYYVIKNEVKVNKKGTFYRRNDLLEWIVYDKATKTVKLSRGCNRVFDILLRDHFYHSDLIRSLVYTVTKTLCKKIIEGKISTLRDFVTYIRSYVVRKKDLPIIPLYKYMVANRLDLLNVLENPETLERVEQITEEGCHTVNRFNIFTYKLEDIGKVRERYDNWVIEQDKKLAVLQRQGSKLVRAMSQPKPTPF